MEAKAHRRAKVYSRRKTKVAQLSCFTEEYASADSSMKKKKRGPSSFSSSSSEDSDYDCNEEDFNCTPSPPIKKSQPKRGNPAQNRKKLALPKAPRSARKRKTSDTEKIAVNRCEIDVFDSEEDTPPRNSKNGKNDQGFEMLVEAAALHKDGGYAKALPSSKSDRNVCSGANKMETKSGEHSGEKETNDYSTSEDDEGNTKDENYPAEDSDSLEKTKIEQNETDKTNVLTSHPMMVRSELATQQTSSVFETLDSAKLSIKINEENNSTELSETRQAAGVGEPEHGKNVVTMRKTCGKLVSASLSSKIPRKSGTEGARVRIAPLGLTGTRVTANSNLEFSAENNSSLNGCLKIPRFQVSSAPHQRVIGLSRRVRPPPLHPYLSKTDR